MMKNYEILQFLKACSKMTINERDKEIIIMCAEKIDDYLAELLERHRVHLLFLKHADELSCLDNINLMYSQRFSDQLLLLQLRYKEHIESLCSVMKELSSTNYAILKGFSYIDELYTSNDIVYRPFSDIDLLVNSTDAVIVENALKKEKFVQGSPVGRNIIPAARKDIIYWKLNSHQLHTYVKFSKFSKVSPLYIIKYDINTTIFEGGIFKELISIDEILKHKIKKKVADNLDIFCLDYTFGLIQLCYHFYKDTVYQLKKQIRQDYSLYKFCDIREYIMKFKANIDWIKFIDIVNQSNMGNQIYHALKYVCTFYGDIDIEDVFRQLSIDKRIDEIDWNVLL